MCLLRSAIQSSMRNNFIFFNSFAIYLPSFLYCLSKACADIEPVT